MLKHTVQAAIFQLCKCGCGEYIPISKLTRRPRKYLPGHQPNFSRALEVRFWEKVDKRGQNDCWEWQAGRTAAGYGVIGAARRDQILLAHRISWELHYSPIPDGLHVLHHCDNPPCVNPHHLFLGTAADNAADRLGKGRQARGEQAGNAKLTQEQVMNIRREFCQGSLVIELAQKYNISLSTIRDIRDRRTWTHLP